MLGSSARAGAVNVGMAGFGVAARPPDTVTAATIVTLAAAPTQRTARPMTRPPRRTRVRAFCPICRSRPWLMAPPTLWCMTGAQREWVTFADPKEAGRRWMIDVTFLTSHWQCIYGAGCQGVLTEPTPEMAQGCCSYGAHFSDDRDRKRTEQWAAKLTDDDWQFAAVGRAKGVSAKSGNSWRTRLVDDACIFLNRTDFAGGPGCALHRYAVRTGHHFMETKPDVCWQLPLRREDRDEDDGTVVSTLSEFGRTGWGDGGQEFAWWCTEAPEAFE